MENEELKKIFRKGRRKTVFITFSYLYEKEKPSVESKPSGMVFIPEHIRMDHVEVWSIAVENNLFPPEQYKDGIRFFLGYHNFENWREWSRRDAPLTINWHYLTGTYKKMAFE